jgi:hypothetical protein
MNPVHALAGALLPIRYTGPLYLEKCLADCGVETDALAPTTRRAIAEFCLDRATFMAAVKHQPVRRQLVEVTEATAFRVASYLRGDRTYFTGPFEDPLLLILERR